MISACEMKTTFYLVALVAVIAVASSDKHPRKEKHVFKEDDCASIHAFIKHFKKPHKISTDCNDANDHIAQVIKMNNDTVNEHNEAFERGEETYTRALSEHSDMTFEEKETLRMGLIERPMSRSLPGIPATTTVTVPASVDYRPFCQPIKNQGNCGACWSFAAIGVIETMWLRAGINKPLSEQNLVDCVTASKGCNGG